MKKKILILGASGMAGHMVYNYLNEAGQYTLFNTVYRTKINDCSIFCDVTDKQAVEHIINEINPHFVINCIGALVRESKINPDNAIYLNAYFPHFLKKICDKPGIRLIHISTDCVFSGKKGNYAESDFRDADDIYGKSKALGEIINDKDVTIRTSIIGPELKQNGEGLFNWFMQQKGDVNGYTRAIWGGITTLELAKAIEKVIEYDLRGLFHVTNGKGISKFELLELFRDIWRKNVFINPFENYIVDKSLALSQHYNFEVPGYSEMFNELNDWMLRFNFYPNYFE